MAKIRICVVGAAGRMGQEILSLVQNSDLYAITARVDSSQKDNNYLLNLAECSPGSIDVVIDFSSPEGFASILQWCADNKIPIISGTTGLLDSQKNLMRKYMNSIPMLWSANMSLGVAVLRQAIKSFAAIKEYDFQIEETHHINKKDKPSGTALMLQGDLEKIVGNVPSPLSLRGGGVFGNHRIHAMGEEEVLIFEHAALNRRVFARGALKAASWLVNKKPGIYEMADMLEGNRSSE